MYQPLSPRLAGPELQGPLGTFPPKRPHSTSSSPRMGSGPVTEAMSRLAPSSPTLWPSRCSGQETREREGGVSPRSCGLRASSSQPCSPLPLSSPGLCSLEQPSPHPAGELECVLENPRCWTGGLCPLHPGPGEEGARRTDGARDPLVGAQLAGFQVPSTPAPLLLPLEAPEGWRRAESRPGGQDILLAGHRTPGRRFPAPVKATRGKGHWGLGLTSSKMGQCPDGQSKLLHK